jgi:hypothetical protein
VSTLPVAGEPALDYLEYMDVSSFGPAAVDWRRTPADVRDFVARRGDRALYDPLTWVGTFHHMIMQSKHQLMTASNQSDTPARE